MGVKGAYLLRRGDGPVVGRVEAPCEADVCDSLAHALRTQANGYHLRALMLVQIAPNQLEPEAFSELMRLSAAP